MLKVPSVTEVIGFGNSAAFAHVPAGRLEIAQERGTEFHDVAAAYAAGLWIESIPDTLTGSYNSFRAWFDKMVVKVFLVEQELTHPIYRYRGTPDLLGLLKGDAPETLSLVDWKTAKVKSKSWRLQLSAYAHLLMANGYPVKRVASLQPDRDGGRAKFVGYTRTIANDFAIFLSGLQWWRFFNESA